MCPQPVFKRPYPPIRQSGPCPMSQQQLAAQYAEHVRAEKELLVRRHAKRAARKRAGDPFGQRRPVNFFSSKAHEGGSDRSDLSSDSDEAAHSSDSDSDSDLGGFLVDD